MAKMPNHSRRRAASPQGGGSPPSSPLPTAATGSNSGPGAVIASAARIPLENLGWDKPRSMQPWQRELWRFVDIIGELNYAAGLVASNFSRSVLRMHDIGPDGEIAGVTKNKRALGIASTILGKPAERREVMRMAGFNLWLTGEVYVGAISGEKDEWFAISSNDLQRDASGGAYVDLGRGKRRLRPGKDVLIRSWTPHPNKASEAHSAPRSIRIVLRELEKLTLYIFAQIDSRLASGGVLVVPAGMSTGDGTITAQDLMASFVETAAEALKGEGTAAGVVPIVLEVPSDAVGKLQHLTFSSELSQQALKLREEAVSRLASALDLPAEEITGMGDTNHWSSYQIGPDAVKKHIEPLLARFCLSLQRGWVELALAEAGLDPDKFHIWYDTTPLIVRPQRFQEALELWREGVLGSQALLSAASFYGADAPEPEEDIRRYLRELVLRDPQMFNQSTVRALLGVTEQMIPSSVGQPALDGPDQRLITEKGTPPPPPPAPETVPKNPVTGRPPVSRQRPPRGVTASASVFSPTPLAMLAVADAVSIRALELAGGRLLDNRSRGQMKGVPRHELHTRIPVTPESHDVEKLLSGWSEHLATLAVFIGIPEEKIDPLRVALQRHCEFTLVSGEPHSRERMISALQVAGVIDGF